MAVNRLKYPAPLDLGSHPIENADNVIPAFKPGETIPAGGQRVIGGVLYTFPEETTSTTATVPAQLAADNAVTVSAITFIDSVGNEQVLDSIGFNVAGTTLTMSGPDGQFSRTFTNNTTVDNNLMFRQGGWMSAYISGTATEATATIDTLTNISYTGFSGIPGFSDIWYELEDVAIVNSALVKSTGKSLWTTVLTGVAAHASTFEL